MEKSTGDSECVTIMNHGIYASFSDPAEYNATFQPCLLPTIFQALTPTLV